MPALSVRIPPIGSVAAWRLSISTYPVQPDPLAEVAPATADLGEARRRAERLATALGAARETTSRLHPAE